MINLIDIGCGHHLPKPWSRKSSSKYIKYFLGFDYFGLDDSKKNIVESNDRVFIIKKLVFDKDGEVLFYVCKNLWLSSIFEPNLEVVKKYVKFLNETDKKFSISQFDIKKEKKNIECNRLDTVINKLNIDFDFIKIDAQGAEFNVLKSIGEYLKRDIIGINIKIFLKEVYKGITLYDEINKFLEKNGFKQIKRFEKDNKFVSDFLYIKENKNKKEKINEIKKIYNV